MARLRRPRPEEVTFRPILGDATDPRSFTTLVPLYLEALAIRGFRPSTRRGRFAHLASFADWGSERNLWQPCQITRPILERYRRWLFYYRAANGRPISFAFQHQRLTSLRGFFRWLARENHILYNPAAELESPRFSRRLPRFVLTVGEVEQLLELPDIENPFGLRDRAILETFYSTGMRRGELVSLKLPDLDCERGTVMIRDGKGGKDRVVPIGERALAWIERYVTRVRAQILTAPDEGHLFLTYLGQPFCPDAVTALVRGYVKRARFGKVGSCHLLRHTCATLMLEGGADVRFVQELLGHASLATTTIYTHVSIAKLKAVHTATHPAAKLESPSTAAAAALEAPVHHLAHCAEPQPEPTTTPEDLLAALAEEADEETDPACSQQDDGPES